jgi:hypothetical protein
MNSLSLTFPHCFVLLWSFTWKRRNRRLSFSLFDVHWLFDISNAAGYLCCTIQNSREVDAHESEDHIMCDVRDIPGGHMRCIENLSDADKLLKYPNRQSDIYLDIRKIS